MVPFVMSSQIGTKNMTYTCLGKEVQEGAQPFKFGEERALVMVYPTQQQQSTDMMKCNN